MTVQHLAEKRNRVNRYRGIPGYVPALPVTAHLYSLLAAGLTRSQIAEQAGVNRRTVHGLLKAERPTLQRRTAARLLAVAPSGTGLYTDATGSTRRLRALARAGWPLTTLAAEAGISHSYARDIASARTKRVSRTVAASIAAVFEDLCLRPGPMRRVATRAKARGWAPPLAWDALDDPRSYPSGEAGPCAGCGDAPAWARGVCHRCYGRERRRATARGGA